MFYFIVASEKSIESTLVTELDNTLEVCSSALLPDMHTGKKMRKC